MAKLTIKRQARVTEVRRRPRGLSPWRALLGIAAAFLALAAAGPSLAVEPSSQNPAWLKSHVGEDDGEIAPVVLQRARALYLSKVKEGEVRNPCYLAMDATRPNSVTTGDPGRRFYVICEADRSFRAIPAGHGGGRTLPGVVDFRNERRCARNFGNALDSQLTTGGAYVTAETVASFKGYYRTSAGGEATLLRPFVRFDGAGDTANARERAIGAHPAVLLGGICRRREPLSPYADAEGYVPFGKLVDYSGGRSDGCTSWSPSDAARLLPLLEDDPTTLYIYPEASDIARIDRALAAGRTPASAGLYWNASCLEEIGAPRFWRKQSLEPILFRYEKEHPAPPPEPVPICQDH